MYGIEENDPVAMVNVISKARKEKPYNLADFSVPTIETWLNDSFDIGLTDNADGRHKMAEQLCNSIWKKVLTIQNLNNKPIDHGMEKRDV